MPTATITAQNTPVGIRDLLQRLSAQLVGRETDTTGGMIHGLQLRLGLVLLTKIQQAFEVKAAGGVGEDGIQWAPLKPATIAARRLSGDDRKAVALKRRVSEAFTPAQQRAIGSEIKAQTSRLIVKFALGEGTAAGLARAHVENRWRKRIKVFGQVVNNVSWPTTMLNVRTAQHNIGHIAAKFAYLSTRHVEILRDTGELLASLSPGVDGPGPGGILRMPSGQIIVGTNVGEKWRHHAGTKTVPARPFWPVNGSLPASWWDAISGALQRGLLEIVMRLVQAKGRR